MRGFKDGNAAGRPRTVTTISLSNTSVQRARVRYENAPAIAEALSFDSSRAITTPW
jgi:hypothetical protein